MDDVKNYREVGTYMDVSDMNGMYNSKPSWYISIIFNGVLKKSNRPYIYSKSYSAVVAMVPCLKDHLEVAEVFPMITSYDGMILQGMACIAIHFFQLYHHNVIGMNPNHWSHLHQLSYKSHDKSPSPIT